MNVRKHAGNADVEVRLAWRDDGVELTVADTGSGAQPSQGGGGYGLSRMAERVQAVGGTVVAGPATGRGFLIEVRVPAGGPPPGS